MSWQKCQIEEADDIQETLGRIYNTPQIVDEELADALDTLGDEIALDDDTNHLDDRCTKGTRKGSRKPQLGKQRMELPVDEFGLPQIPNRHQY